MILSTTNAIEGKTIKNYLGIVSTTAYVDYAYSNLSLKDIFKQKKYFEAYEKSLEEAKEEAFQKLKENAQKLKANAIVAISVDVESVSSSMYTLVSLVGTAVELD